MINIDIKDLLFRYRNGVCTDIEKKAIEHWLAKIENGNTSELNTQDMEELGLSMRKELLNHTQSASIFGWATRWYWYVATMSVAAAILLFFVVYPLFDDQSYIFPAGTDRAMLLTDNGDTVDLTNLAVGEVLEMHGICVLKKDSGEIVYELLPNLALTDTNGVNTLIVPKGGKYKLALSDGTEIKLNASSKLKYPTHFGSNRRWVELSGEGYFEVARDNKRSFKVYTDRGEVEVLGTKFNIKAYPEDDDWTTAVTHGSVKVTTPHTSKVLYAKDIAVIDKQGNLRLSQTISLDESIAWNEGSFRFRSTTIEEIAKQVERWYDVKVKINPEVSGLKFYGIISKQQTANQLFEILEETHTIKADFTKEEIIIRANKN